MLHGGGVRKVSRIIWMIRKSRYVTIQQNVLRGSWFLSYCMDSRPGTSTYECDGELIDFCSNSVSRFSTPDSPFLWHKWRTRRRRRSRGRWSSSRKQGSKKTMLTSKWHFLTPFHPVSCFLSGLLLLITLGHERSLRMLCFVRWKYVFFYYYLLKIKFWKVAFFIIFCCCVK